MIKASDMLKLSKESATTIIDEIFEKSDFKEHSLKRIQEEARHGRLLYEFHFSRKLLTELRDMLLDKLESIIKEFEDNGFKVLIRDYGNRYWSNICVKFYWGDICNKIGGIMNYKLYGEGNIIELKVADELTKTCFTIQFDKRML